MQEAPAQGGGVADALKTLGQGLSAATQDESVPEEARAAFSAALEAFSQGMSILEGGGQAPSPSEPVSMEQGASKGAVPMSHGRPG
jgi:hypothetical protein